MDQLLRELERQLTGPAGQVAKEILAGQYAALNPQHLRALIYAMIASAADRELILAFLKAAARAGLLAPEATLIITTDAELMAAAIAASEAEIAAASAAGAIAEAEAVAAGGVPFAEMGAGAGAAAGGVSAAAVAAAVTMLASIAFMLWSIANEVSLTTKVPGPMGVPCGVGTPGGQYMAKVYRTVSAWGIGQKTALNRALSRAEALCKADSAKCGAGGCAPGKTCQPSVVVDRVDIFPAVVATRVVVGFTCPCVCA